MVHVFWRSANLFKIYIISLGLGLGGTGVGTGIAIGSCSIVEALLILHFPELFPYLPRCTIDRYDKPENQVVKKPDQQAV